MTLLTQNELAGKSVVELRRLARDEVRLGKLAVSTELATKGEMIGHWIACANARQLVHAILCGVALDEVPGNGGDGTPPKADTEAPSTGDDDDDDDDDDPDTEAPPKPEPKPEPQPEPEKQPEAPKSDLEKLIAKIANNEANVVYDEKDGYRKEKIAGLAALIKAELAKSGNGAVPSTEPQTLIIKRPDLPDVEVKNVHQLLKKVMTVLASTRKNGTHLSAYLWGESGAGKTTISKQIADAFGVKFFPFSCAKDTPSYQVFGYCTADGTYVASSFRTCYEFGGVYLMDEVDSASDSTTTSLNTALGNGYCLFPDGKLVKAHKDFYFIAGGNTTLAGATARYSARRKLDGAFAERLDVFFEIKYDPAIETVMAQGNLEWRDYVWAVREAVKHHSIDHLVTPRAIERGAILLKAGLSRREVEDCALWRGLSKEDITMIKHRVKETTATPESETPQTTTEGTKLIMKQVKLQSTGGQ